MVNFIGPLSDHCLVLSLTPPCCLDLKDVTLVACTSQGHLSWRTCPTLNKLTMLIFILTLMLILVNILKLSLKFVCLFLCQCLFLIISNDI